MWILVKILNFGQNCEFGRIVIFGQNCEFWLKLWILVKTVNFGQNCEFWSKLWFLVKIVNFGQNCEFWSKMWLLVKIYNFGQNCGFCSKMLNLYFCYLFFFVARIARFWTKKKFSGFSTGSSSWRKTSRRVTLTRSQFEDKFPTRSFAQRETEKRSVSVQSSGQVSRTERKSLQVLALPSQVPRPKWVWEPDY